MLKLNCNHFTHEFLISLLGRGLPRHLNRAAYIGSYFHCIVPKRFLIVTPDMENADVVLEGVDSKSTTASGVNEGDESIDELTSDEDRDLIFENPNKDSKSRNKR
jgi:hypothetical protein